MGYSDETIQRLNAPNCNSLNNMSAYITREGYFDIEKQRIPLYENFCLSLS